MFPSILQLPNFSRVSSIVFSISSWRTSSLFSHVSLSPASFTVSIHIIQFRSLFFVSDDNFCFHYYSFSYEEDIIRYFNTSSDVRITLTIVCSTILQIPIESVVVRGRLRDSSSGVLLAYFLALHFSKLGVSADVITNEIHVLLYILGSKNFSVKADVCAD